MRKKKDRKKSKKTEEKNSVYLTPYQSTQSTIPVADIYNGIVVTKDNRYIKIMELTPVPFTMYTAGEQNKVIDAFQTVLMQCPDNVQFSALTLPADLSEQKQVLDDNLKNETIKPLLKMGEEYRKVLEAHEQVSLRRRFFLSFEYSREYNVRKLPDIDTIVDALNDKAYSIEAALARCGNSVIYPIKGSDMTEQVEEILYAFFNRDSEVNFTDHKRDILDKYREYMTQNDSNQIYINPVEYIAPSSIDFRNSKYVLTNNKTYYTFAYISSSGYNQYVIGGWMTMFINSFSGVDVTIKLQRDTSDLLRTSIRNAIKMNKGDLYNAREDSGGIEEAEDALQGGRYLNEGLRYGADFYYVSVMLTITGESIDEVETKFAELKQMSRNQRITLSRYTFQMEDAYYGALPLAIFNKELQSRARRNVLTDGAASFYPLTTPEFINPNGLFLGIDETTNTPVIPDIWDRKLGFVNMNIGIFGISGGGKTVTSLTLAARMRMQQIPVVIFACEKEHEYIRITQALGGKFVSLATGSKDRINILDIYPRDESADEEVYGTSGNRSYLEEKVETLIEWIEMKTGKLLPEDKTLLNIAIHETYKRPPFCITPDNESLYDPTDPEHKRFKQMPIIEDLYNVLMENEKTQRIGTILSYYVKGSGKSFNGHTNVDLTNKFIVFGLEGMNEEDFPAGMHLALDYVWSKVKEDKTKRKAILFDEFWKVCRSKSAVSLAAKMIRLVRAYSTSMVVATQELDDLFKYDGGTLGKTIMSNSRTRFLLQMDEKAAKEVGEILDLTPEHISRIEKESPGHVLLSIGSTYIKLNIVNSRIEKYLMYTDEKTLNEWKNHKQDVERILYGSSEDDEKQTAYSEMIRRLREEASKEVSTVRKPYLSHEMTENNKSDSDEQEIDSDEIIDNVIETSYNNEEHRLYNDKSDTCDNSDATDSVGEDEIIGNELLGYDNVENTTDITDTDDDIYDVSELENTIESAEKELTIDDIIADSESDDDDDDNTLPYDNEMMVSNNDDIQDDEQYDDQTDISEETDDTGDDTDTDYVMETDDILSDEVIYNDDEHESVVPENDIISETELYEENVNLNGNTDEHTSDDIVTDEQDRQFINEYSELSMIDIKPDDRDFAKNDNVEEIYTDDLFAEEYDNYETDDEDTVETDDIIVDDITDDDYSHDNEISMDDIIE